MISNPKTKALRLPRNSAAWKRLVAAVFRRDGHQCQITGIIYPPEQLAAHHITGTGRGGSDVIENLVTVSGKDHIALGHQPHLMTKQQADMYRAAVERISR